MCKVIKMFFFFIAISVSTYCKNKVEVKEQTIISQPKVITIKAEKKALKKSLCELDFNKFNLKGLKFFSSKTEILQKLGKPLKIFEPNYECGGLSSEWQGIKYFTIDYGFIKFTGNTTEKYLIDKLLFKNVDVFIFYGKNKLSNETTVEKLSEIFGSKVLDYFKNNTKKGSFIVFSKETDEGIILKVSNGKLIELQYYTPC